MPSLLNHITGEADRPVCCYIICNRIIQHVCVQLNEKDKMTSLSRSQGVAKMTSHGMFQYNVLTIDDTHNTGTNMIVKMNIPRLLGSSDDKEKIGVARPEGPPLKALRSKGQESKRP